MRTTSLLCAAWFAVLIAALAPAQDANAPTPQRPQAPAEELKGMPPRSAPTDYQAVAQAGPLSIAADFDGHSVPTADGVYSSDDYVVVEAAVFGPPGEHATLSIDNFSLEINGKKAVPPEHYERVRGSLKDPEWAPPTKSSKPKTSINGGGEDTSTAPPRMPMDLRVAMEQHVRAAVMLQGDRALPQAGLLFFPYRGKTQNIRSLQLLYSGPTGKATLNLQP